MFTIPPHVLAQIDQLRIDGWVPAADELTGLTLAELAVFYESEAVPFREVGPWQDGDVPRVVHLVHLPSLLEVRSPRP